MSINVSSIIKPGTISAGYVGLEGSFSKRCQKGCSKGPNTVVEDCSLFIFLFCSDFLYSTSQWSSFWKRSQGFTRRGEQIVSVSIVSGEIN